eukprot:jgi/Chlat1/1831/Chrsp14S02229
MPYLTIVWYRRECRTAPCYRIYAVEGKYPALMQSKDGASIEVELFDVTPQGLAMIMADEPRGLMVGLMKMDDGSTCFGVLGEPYIIQVCQQHGLAVRLICICISNMRDITAYRGWRNYTAKAAPDALGGFELPAKVVPRRVDSKPYLWPYDGHIRPDNTTLLIIDMQVDFCGEGGYVDRMGYDLTNARATIPKIKRVLEVFRRYGFHVMHTREGHRPNTLSDLPKNKLWRSRELGAGIGDDSSDGRILTRGEKGWEIIPELAPLDGEDIIEKPGKGSFYATDLDMLLRRNRIRNIVLCGLTTDVCVHTTMRDANDRGYECLLLTDCSAATDAANHEAACNMVTKQGGVFGAIADSTALIEALTAPLFPVARPLPDDKANLQVVVKAEPYDFMFPVASTAVLMIDMQKDFVLHGGFGAALGNKVELLQAIIPAVSSMLVESLTVCMFGIQNAAREHGVHVIHTLEAHYPDCSDLHSTKITRGNPPVGKRIGDAGDMGRILIRHEYGNNLVDECDALPAEKKLWKPGKGSFYNTELADYLKIHGITHLLIGGVTSEVCVQTTLREANDRGYQCLLLEDCTESYFPEFKAAAVSMVKSQGAIGGWVATSTAVQDALHAATTGAVAA